jgi:ubiquinone/menaquinone biosynthesis C-methylase UbiE
LEIPRHRIRFIRSQRWHRIWRVLDRVPSGLAALLRGAERGDWRMRTACLSAVGKHLRLRALPGRALDIVLRHFPNTVTELPGTRFQGRYLLGRIADSQVDRSWPVRVAAALALGESRSWRIIAALQRQLAAPYRAERIAAAAAIVSCGGRVEGGPTLLAGALSTPSRVGDGAKSIEVLEALGRAHGSVLEKWREVPGQDQPPRGDAGAWGAFLAGAPYPESPPDLNAEIDRYEDEGDVEYLLTKPFSAINHVQNPRLLHAFLVACEQLRLPARARVLDLGGGSGWVSELLARYGCVPVTIDVSTALLKLGKRRFARSGLTPRFAAADMRHLPIADASMDGVIVLDALHHVPDVPAVFAEAFRVLGEGAAFVLAEPGEGHAESDVSLREMREYGVQEREIHVSEMFEYARRAGFRDVRVVPHYEPGIAMTEAQVDAAVTAPADDWMVLNEDRPGYFAAYVIQAMFNHPILVARKGGGIADSRRPHILRGDLSARLTRDGRRVTGTVTASNTGNTIWIPGTGRGCVRLGIQLLGADRTLQALDFARAELSGRVAPGESVEIPLDITLPDAAAHVLKLDLVDEDICWFGEVGSKPIYFEG